MLNQSSNVTKKHLNVSISHGFKRLWTNKNKSRTPTMKKKTHFVEKGDQIASMISIDVENRSILSNHKALEESIFHVCEDSEVSLRKASGLGELTTPNLGLGTQRKKLTSKLSKGEKPPDIVKNINVMTKSNSKNKREVTNLNIPLAINLNRASLMNQNGNTTPLSIPRNGRNNEIGSANPRKLEKLFSFNSKFAGAYKFLSQKNIGDLTPSELQERRNIKLSQISNTPNLIKERRRSKRSLEGNSKINDINNSIQSLPLQPSDNIKQKTVEEITKSKVGNQNRTLKSSKFKKNDSKKRFNQIR